MLLPLLGGLALAGVDDIVLDFTVTEPLGTPLLRRQVALPHTEEVPLTLGAETYVVRVEASVDAGAAVREALVDLVVVVYRVDGPSRSRTRLASPALNLGWGERESATAIVLPEDPIWGPDGQPMSELRFGVAGSWSEGAPVVDWIRARREEPIAPGMTVLAWSDAVLFTAPGAVAGRLEGPVDRSTLGPGAVAAWEVLADEGEYLRVRSMTPRESRMHCVGSHQALAWLDMRLYVRREDLLLTTRTSAVMEYSDGTGSSLLAGVPLLPLSGQSLYGRPAFLGLSSGVRFRIGLPEAPVALAYEPLAGGADEATAWWVAAGAAGQLGQLATGPVELLSGEPRAPAALVSAPGQDPAVVSVGGRCGWHRVKTPAAGVSPATPAVDEIQFGDPGEPSAPASPTLPSGTPLWWTDGTQAGTVRRGRTLLTPPEPHGARVCYDLASETSLITGQPTQGARLLVCTGPPGG